jgi:choline dehydrogenase
MRWMTKGLGIDPSATILAKERMVSMIHGAAMQTEASEASSETRDVVFEERVESNQRKLRSNLRQTYDFIVCGSGSSGSVVARRLAEDPAVNVLLLEAGGTDTAPQVQDASRWLENLGSVRDWAFKTRPNPYLNGRSLLWSMGKVLGGGSSINGMAWARGHKNDWDYFAKESGDDGWSYRNVLDIYRRIEDWRGAPDPERRGSGGLVVVEQSSPLPIISALCEAAQSFGIPSFVDHNGAMMEGDGGAAPANVRIQDGRRLSVFRTYVYPCMDQPNLTVLTHALVTRVKVKGRRAIGVEVLHESTVRTFNAGNELILSLGAIQTPKVLMQSGIGDAQDLRKFGIDVTQHLPGVGCNLQEHLLLGGCMWEHSKQEDVGPGTGTFFWKSDPGFDTPDLQCFINDGAFLSPDLSCPNTDGSYWTILPGVVRPQSQGRIRLSGPDPTDPVDVDTNLLSHPADLKALMWCTELCRDIGNSVAFRSLAKREVLPTHLGRAELESFVRNAVVPFWHFSCTAKMGRDELSVVDASLKVHGIDGLRIADSSIMPRVSTGNTMAPCVVIGERAAAMIRKAHGI